MAHGGWMLVERAPRDGRHVLLLFAPDEKRFILEEGGAIEGWYFSSPKEIDDGWETYLGSIGDPVAWAQLPSETDDKGNG